jgi:sulfite oxidase
MTRTSRSCTRGPLNAETRARAGPGVTPTADFYVRNHGPVPPPPSSFAVGGLVDAPLELTVADLRSRFPARELVATLQCAGNRRAGLMAVRDIPGEMPWGPGATGTATWRGVMLADVLAAAACGRGRAHRAGGAEPAVESGEPFGGSITREKALTARSCWPGR